MLNSTENAQQLLSAETYNKQPKSEAIKHTTMSSVT